MEKNLCYFLNLYGFADDVGIYAITDEFGNTFRSFFIACDLQDLQAAGVYSPLPVRRREMNDNNNNKIFLNFLFFIIIRLEAIF